MPREREVAKEDCFSAKRSVLLESDSPSVHIWASKRSRETYARRLSPQGNTPSYGLAGSSAELLVVLCIWLSLGNRGTRPFDEPFLGICTLIVIGSPFFEKPGRLDEGNIEQFV